MLQPSKEQAEGHYTDLSSKPFFPALVQYFSSGPIVGMVWEGKNVVKSGRTLLGATNPADSLPGTIRGDYAVDVGRNVCHGSDSVESATREIAFWFKPEEVVSWTSHSANQIYE
ncbi:nucleoside-diphosphate kinase [Angomonas deanei]|nr:nucleoside-diphosphate kinase [Angomonas deanei]|eukprot:EPY34815.1 nucleoside-diphosphate kinase [Angomonas deanei]